MSRIEPSEQSFDPARWSETDAARHTDEGVRLFNAGDYHAAHEEFEQVWLSTQGPDSDFFKGLIQACIALHHLQRGNVAGALKLYSGHRRYLAAYAPAHLRIDVSAFLSEMQRFFQPLARHSPGLEAVVDESLRPQLRRVQS